ncbi:hypothetical protein D9599_06945 [Roseomonas sp. KE2513]|uniref:hypothetical protein n=1 Tax=Roseomonas sp. KE2513 TaxID=2479202 RepID=UPI0018DFBD78|nr:hypothetical protein [Roseomonas sp. KE2513]MBI0535303.1 hypothetical protein [Roseomonas sp. KE2513]
MITPPAAPGTVTVFEDAEIVVRAIPGAPGHPTLVTFGDYTRRPDQPGFWGASTAAALGWPAIGFVARRPNWYPAASVLAAAPLVRARLDDAEAIGYGYSMGGYGALKYGRTLGLSAALAISPQASIAPADVPEDTRWHVLHDPVLHAGMRVTATDLAPRVWMVTDPRAPGDGPAASLLAAEGVRLVPAYGLFHGTMALLAGRTPLAEALASLRADDPARLRRLIRARRRDLAAWHAGTGAVLLGRGREAAGTALLDCARQRGLTPYAEAEALGFALRSGAEPVLARLLAVEGLSAEGHASRSFALAGAGRPDLALRAAKAGLAIFPENPALLTQFGHLLLAEGLAAEAHAALARAHALRPTDGWILVGLSGALLGLDDAAGAERTAREALALPQAGAFPHFALGNALRAQGRPGEAEAAYAAALSLGLESARPLRDSAHQTASRLSARAAALLRRAQAWSAFRHGKAEGR